MGKQAPLRSPLGTVPHRSSYCLSHPPPPHGKPVPGAKKGADRWLRGKPFHDPEHSFPAKERGLTERTGLEDGTGPKSRSLHMVTARTEPRVPSPFLTPQSGPQSRGSHLPEAWPTWNILPQGPRQSSKDRAQQANRKAQRVPPQRSPACQKSSGPGTTQPCPTLAYIPPATGSSLPTQAASV